MMTNETVVKNITALRERMRVVLDTWDNVSMQMIIETEFVEYIGLRLEIKKNLFRLYSNKNCYIC
jgi:hypothetical protein